MKPLRLLLAVAVMLGLAGAIWYSEKNPPKPKDEIKTTKIISVGEDQIRRVRITRSAGDTLAMERGEDSKWRLTEPKAYKAEEYSANNVANSLASLNAEQLVAEKNTDWASFGLESPKIRVSVGLKDGKELKLALGDEAPTSSAIYARLEGDDRLFTIGSYVKSSLDKSPADLRDKRILPFDSDKVSRLTVTTKERTLEFGKAGTAWQIVKPRPLRADNYSVDDLVRTVRDANFESVLDESGKPPAKYSFASPYAVFEVVDPGGVHTLTVGRHEEKDKETKDKAAKDKAAKKDTKAAGEKKHTYFAKTSAMPGVFQVSVAMSEALNKKLDDFRNKKLFEFAWSDPQKLEVRDGDLRMVIEKKADKWLRADAGSKELPADKVQALIDNLRNMTSKAFTADDASAQARYGLEKPVAEAKVTSDEGKRVERVFFAAASDRHYAAREKEPATYEIDKNAVADFQRSLAALK